MSESAAVHAVSKSGAGRSSVEGSAARKVKLLLVDDNQENLVALEAALTPLGEQLYSARSGEDALRLCLEHDFGAILLDVRMPDMDGFETANLIRSRPRSRHTPILFLTAYRSDEHLFRGYDLGAVDFLFKPIVPEILQSKVTVFIELSRNAELLRRQAASLARAEKQFRGLIEAAPDAMLITSESGEIVLVNSRSEELFGYPRAELMNTRIQNLVPGWNAPAFAVDEDEEDTDAPVRAGAERVLVRRRDGSEFPADITMSVFRNEGELLVTAAVRDMTDAVVAETRLRSINAELENKVSERTSELTRSNEALKQFAWAASHDLQEPLRMTITYSQWLDRVSRAKLSDHEKSLLQCIQDNAIQMEQLLDSLRKYLLVRESAPEELQTVDLNAVVPRVLDNLRSLIDDTGALISFGTMPVIVTIDILVSQVLQNLVANAIKYRGSRTPEVQIAASRAQHAWLFHVSDNGIGIEPQHHQYIFGAFKRLHRGNGAGMGLAICKASVERLGGRMWVESEPGVGSTFYFTLPDIQAANATL